MCHFILFTDFTKAQTQYKKYKILAAQWSVEWNLLRLCAYNDSEPWTCLRSMEPSTQVESHVAATVMRWVRTFHSENSSLFVVP